MSNFIADSFNTYLVILIHGALVLLSFLFFSNVFKVNRKANLFFGAFLFIWSTYWIEEILVIMQLNTLNSSVELSMRFVQFLTPIFFYFGTVHYANPKFTFKSNHFYVVLLPILYLAGLIYINLDPANSKLQVLLIIAVILHALFFIYKSYDTIQNHKKRLIQFSSLIEERDLKWIEQIIVTILILLIFIGLYNIFFSAQYLNLFANLFSFIIVFFVAFNGVRQQEIYIMNVDQQNEKSNSDKDFKVDKRRPFEHEELEKLKDKLIALMQSEEPYLNPDLNLLQLASMISITPHQLSYLINEGFKENFFSFINKYRIEKVKSNLTDLDKNNLSILGIAYDCGFNSKTAFYNTFKKITSMTPSEYIKRSSSL